MSVERNIDVARIFHEAWNDADPERGAAVIADDCQFVVKVVSGRDYYDVRTILRQLGLTT